MPETTKDATSEVAESQSVEVPQDDQSAAVGTSTADAGDPPGAEALGDPGKKALDAMKAERNAAKSELAALRAEFEALKAAQEGREAEHLAAVEAQKIKDEALAAADERILKAEVRAQAASKLADPTDALLYLDLSTFEVGEDGAVDADAVSAAIEQLIVSKPYLAAQGRKFEGSADAGVRKAAGPVQLTRDDLAGMSADEINKARSDGRLADLLSGK